MRNRLPIASAGVYHARQEEYFNRLLGSLFWTLTLAALVAWVASIYDVLATLLAVSGVTFLLVVGALGISAALESALGPSVKPPGHQADDEATQPPA